MESRQQELLEKHKDQICKLFRQAVKSRLVQWDCEKAIEEFIDHEIDTSVVIGDLASRFNFASEVADLSEKEILETIINNLARPALNPPSRDT